MSDEVGKELQKTYPQTRAMPVCFRGLDWQYKGGGTRVLLIGCDAQMYYDVNRERSNPVPNLHLFHELAEQPGTVVVSENFAELYHVKAGDMLAVPALEGTVELRVLGAVEDYSWNRGTIFVHRSAQMRKDLDL